MENKPQTKRDFDDNPELEIRGRGGYRPNSGRPKGMKNRTPSRRLIEEAVCLHFGVDKEEIEKAKVQLLQSYLKSGDKGLQYFCEVLFGKAVDVQKLQAEVLVVTERNEDEVEDLFFEEVNEDDDGQA
jgi:hypothetical protein